MQFKVHKLSLSGPMNYESEVAINNESIDCARPMVNVDKSVSGARRKVWKANWTDRRTHSVTIVHTCG